MLEYFTYKKYKSNKAKEADAKKDEIPAVPSSETTQTEQPLLDKEDERYLSDLISEAETPPVVILEGRAESPLPDLPPGPSAAASPVPPSEEVGGAKPQAVAEVGQGPREVGVGAIAARKDGLKETEESKKLKEKDGKLFAVVEKRASILLNSGLDLLRPNKDKDKSKEGEKEMKDGAKSSMKEESADKKDKGKEKEKKKDKKKEKVKKEKADGEEELDESVLTSMMERLNLSSINGKLIAKSPEIKQSVNKFTQILKDINNGVPTAYNDLIDLFDTSSDTFARFFDSLPKTLQNFIMRTLPAKLTPEVLRTLAATSPALAAELQAGSAMGLKELIGKPGLVASLLKSVVTFLKTRFPLLMGGGMAVSVGVTIVMLILWYCYKRGKEVRLEDEAKAASAASGCEGESSHSTGSLTSESQSQPISSDLPPPPQPVPQTSFDKDIGHSDTLHESGP